MANNKDSSPVYFSEITQADKQLSVVKTSPSVEFFDVSSVALAEAPKNKSLHFVKSENYWKKFVEKCHEQKLNDVYVIAHKSLITHVQQEKYITQAWSSENVELTMTKISKLLYEKKFSQISTTLDGRISGTAVIHPTAIVSPLAFIGEYVHIGANAEVMPGAHISAYSTVQEASVLYPRVTIYSFVNIGKNCRLHAGVVVGSDGFGYVFDKGFHQKIWHIGGVIIKDHVEIGANSCVDAGTFVPTIIEEGCIIDNLVQVGHNTQLGKGVILCGQSGTGGSSKAGDYAVFGGKSALGPQCEVGKYSRIAGGAMVNKSWGEKMELGGYPARPLKEWLRSLALLKKITETDKKNDI